MPSAIHRGLVELFRRDLSLVHELVHRALGTRAIEGLCHEERDGRLVAYSFVQQPREIQVDLLTLAFHAHLPGRPLHIVTTLECQLGLDAEKRFRLLEYIAAARRDFRCSGQSVVFSPDPDVIEEYRAMFADEPHHCPVLVGPSAVPMILTVEAAIERPAMATLSAIVHARSEQGPAIIEALVESWRHFDAPTWHADARILWSCIPEEVMSELSIPIQLERIEADLWDDDDDDDTEPSNWEKGTGLYQRALRAGRVEGVVEGRREGIREGLVAGLRRSLNSLLAARGLTPTAEQRATIDACDDADALERWLVRASCSAELVLDP
ncbi:hypothetical protein ACNOYE_01980 [Nannocystaceae bacterium ST9]